MAHSFMIVFRPGMQPVERHAIEDQLEEAFGGEAEIIGGGTAVDLSECDISIEVADRDQGLALIRKVLREIKAPPATVIIEFEPEKKEHGVYE